MHYCVACGIVASELMANVAESEYEYNTPEGSDVLTEIRKCLEHCKPALA